MDPQVDRGRAALLGELEQAFGGLPVPSASNLILPGAESQDPQGVGQLRRLLGGRRWQDLSPAHATQSWSAFCYLTAEARRYYEPGLLRAVLLSAADAGLAHSVTYHLNPSYWCLYWQGRDESLATFQAALSARQYAAVIEFLGCMFDTVRLRHRAATALRHGWNAQPKARAYKLAMDWYCEMTTWLCPPATGKAAEVVASIGQAFAETRCPPLESMCASAQGDEPAELAMELAGFAWQGLHPEFLDLNSSCLSFFTPAAVCHFLPAYMRADALGLLRTDGPVFALTHGLSASLEHSIEATKQRIADKVMAADRSTAQPAVDWDGYTRGKFAPLSTRQRAAVRSYLEFVRDRDGDWHEEQAAGIDESIETYWGKGTS